MNDKQTYQAMGLRPDGSTYTGLALECQSEDDAKALAQHYADRQRHTVKLYRAPFVNTGSEQLRFICPARGSAGASAVAFLP